MSPAIEGRLAFIADTIGAGDHGHHARLPRPTGTPTPLKLGFRATDTPAGVRSVTARIDGKTAVRNGQTLDLRTLKLGSHSLKVTAVDRAGNSASSTVTFRVTATVKSLVRSVNLYYSEHKITRTSLKTRLVSLLNAAEHYRTHHHYRQATLMLSMFNVTVALESGRHIYSTPAHVLMSDASYVMNNIRK